MKKETSNNNASIPIPETSTNDQQSITNNTKLKFRSPTYKYAGKESLSQILGKLMPKEFLPTKRVGSIFGSIFVIVIILALIQAPFEEIFSGQIDGLIISVGYPLPFLELDIINSKKSPALPKNLLIDIIIYIILAYAIDVILSLILRNPFLKSKNEKEQKPQIFKNRELSLAEKVTGKILKEPAKQPVPQSQPIQNSNQNTSHS